MAIVTPEVEYYIAGLRPEARGVRAEMEALAAQRGFPIIGPEVGRLLALLCRSSGARRVLELGSGFGYSALWFASAMPDGGRVVCTDGSEENRDSALAFLGRAGLGNKVRYQVGDALELLAGISGPFDIVLCDIDKAGYPDALEPAVAILRPGGLLITDNTLWKGRVCGEEPGDEATEAIRRFNRAVADHQQLSSVILPLRDGLTVAIKAD